MRLQSPLIWTLTFLKRPGWLSCRIRMTKTHRIMSSSSLWKFYVCFLNPSYWWLEYLMTRLVECNSTFISLLVKYYSSPTFFQPTVPFLWHPTQFKDMRKKWQNKFNFVQKGLVPTKTYPTCMWHALHVGRHASEELPLWATCPKTRLELLITSKGLFKEVVKKATGRLGI